MKCEKIFEMLVDKDSISSCKSKNRVILEWLRLRFLAIRVVEIGAILRQSEAFERKCIELVY